MNQFDEITKITLKCYLFESGISISAEVLNIIKIKNNNQEIYTNDYITTSGLTLVINNILWVNVQVNRHSKTLLLYSDNQFTLFFENNLYLVDVVPTPKYINQLNSNNERYGNYAVTHCDRVRISPISGCSLNCFFCNIPYNSNKYVMRDINDLYEAIDLSLVDPILPAKHILISGGTPFESDMKYLKFIYKEITQKYSKYDVDGMFTPHVNSLDPCFLKNIGINQISANIEIYDEEISAKIMPKKSKLFIKSRWDYLKYAVDVLGSGKVRSILIVGLEPLSSTLRGAEKLISLGVIPVLSPYIPNNNFQSNILPSKQPSAEIMIKAFKKVSNMMINTTLSLGPKCIPCSHNTIKV